MFDESNLPSRHVAASRRRIMWFLVPREVIADSIERATVKFNRNQKVEYTVSNPISWNGGVVGLRGPLAPQGAIVRSYTDRVGAARTGAVTDAGGKAEIVGYADI